MEEYQQPNRSKSYSPYTSPTPNNYHNKLHHDNGRISPSRLNKLPPTSANKRELPLLSPDKIISSTFCYSDFVGFEFEQQLIDRCKSENEILTNIRSRVPTALSHSSNLSVSDYMKPQVRIVLEKQHKKHVIDQGKKSKVKQVCQPYISDNISIGSTNSTTSTSTKGTKSKSKSIPSVRALVSSKLYKPKKACVLYQDIHIDKIPSKFPDYSIDLKQKQAKDDLFSKVSMDQVMNDRKDFQNGNKRMNRAVNSRGKFGIGMLNIDVAPQAQFDPNAKVKKKKKKKKVGTMAQYLYSLLHTQLNPDTIINNINSSSSSSGSISGRSSGSGL